MTIDLTRRGLLGGIAAGAALAGSGTAFAQGSNAPIRLGCVAPLSGAQEILGAPMRLGAEIAAKQINKTGGVLGRQIEIVARDDKARVAAWVDAGLIGKPSLETIERWSKIEGAGWVSLIVQPFVLLHEGLDPAAVAQN